MAWTLFSVISQWFEFDLHVCIVLFDVPLTMRFNFIFYNFRMMQVKAVLISKVILRQRWGEVCSEVFGLYMALWFVVMSCLILSCFCLLCCFWHSDSLTVEEGKLTTVRFITVYLCFLYKNAIYQVFLNFFIHQCFQPSQRQLAQRQFATQLTGHNKDNIP